MRFHRIINLIYCRHALLHFRFLPQKIFSALFMSSKIKPKFALSMRALNISYQKQNMPSYLKNGSGSTERLLDTSQYYNQLIYVPRQATISSITTDTTGFRYFATYISTYIFGSDRSSRNANVCPCVCDKPVKSTQSSSFWLRSSSSHQRVYKQSSSSLQVVFKQYSSSVQVDFNWSSNEL